MENNVSNSDNVPMYDIYKEQEKYIGKGKSRILSNIAGLLMIIPGFLAFLVGFVLFSTGSLILVVIGALQFFVAIPSLIGGVYAIKQKHHKIALIGAILSIFIFVIPGIIAVILLFISEDEFES